MGLFEFANEYVGDVTIPTLSNITNVAPDGSANYIEV